jgi:hypothetical protein
MGARRVGRAREVEIISTPMARVWASRAATSLRWRSRRHLPALYGPPAVLVAVLAAREAGLLFWSLIAVAFLTVAGLWRTPDESRWAYLVTAGGIVAALVTVIGFTPTTWLFARVIPGPGIPLAGWVAFLAVWAWTLDTYRRWLNLRDVQPDTLPPLAWAWDTWVIPKILPGSWLNITDETDDKTTAEIHWDRELGRTADDVIAKAPQIAAALRAQAGTLVIETHDEGSHAAYLTLFAQNPLAESPQWPGPTFNPEDGVAEAGTYSDGTKVGVQFLSPSGGRGGLIAGATNSGKSAFISWLLREAYDSGVVVPIFLDPQEGQSAPEWTGHIAAVHGAQDCAIALNLIARHVMARSTVMGKLRLGNYRLTDLPKHGLPPILLIVDELPVLTGGETKGQVVEALNTIAQTGRKVGISPWVATQSPLLDSFAGGLFAGQLASANTVMFRLDKRSGSAMLGGQAAIAATNLPMNLPGRRPTSGMAFSNGIDGRAVPWRDWHPDSIPTPDIAGPANGDPTLGDLTRRLIESLPLAGLELPLDDAPEDEPAPDLIVVPDRPKHARDAVMRVVDEHGGVASTEVIQRTVQARWGLSESSVTKALRALVFEGQQMPGAGLARNARAEYVLSTHTERKAS